MKLTDVVILVGVGALVAGVVLYFAKKGGVIQLPSWVPTGSAILDDITGGTPRTPQEAAIPRYMPTTVPTWMQ